LSSCGRSIVIGNYTSIRYLRLIIGAMHYRDSRGRSQFSRSSTAYLSPQLRGDEIAPLHFDEPGRIQSMSAVVAGSSGDYGLSQSCWEGVFAREDPWNYDNA
jgi:hypothetical protein